MIPLALTPLLRAERLVLARSTVSSEYLEKRSVDGKLQPQSYVFMPGHYLAGQTRDKSLERVSFRTIAEQLGMALRSQDFHPAPSLAKADLLLVVHWGATAGRNGDSVALTQSLDALANVGNETEVVQQQFADAMAEGNYEQASLARDRLTSLADQSRSEYQDILRSQRNPDGDDSAAILGLTSELRREGGTQAERERRKTLHDMTREECYFVVITAYEAPTFVGAKRLKRVWTLRTSISTAGVNFPEALGRMGDVASQYFATRQEGVLFNYPLGRNRKGTVELRDIVVLGPVEP